MVLVNGRFVLLKLMIEGEYPSGQRGQTVNLVTLVFAGSNPASPSFCLWAFVLGLLGGFRLGLVELVSNECGRSSMVEFQPSKLAVWVRFPSPALCVLGAV